MREYSTKISLTKNARGVYSLDPSIGCAIGMANEVGGCFNDCYAAKASKLYGYDFSKTVLRDFESETHRRSIVRKIDRIALDFVRMGTSGDPSEDWAHTVKILKAIGKCNKEIVIITKHWNNLTESQLEYLGTINVCVNTSVSAFDKPHILENAITQHKGLKTYCKAILRVVSAKMNLENVEGQRLATIQSHLLSFPDVLDTVLRVNKRNPLYVNGVIQAEATPFLGKNVLASKANKGTYFGSCGKCHEQCGLNVAIGKQEYPTKRGITKQLSLFKRF